MDSLKEKVEKAQRALEALPMPAASSSPTIKLHSFIKQAWKYVEPSLYLDSWHTHCIAEHLEAVSHLQINKLIVNAPPRHTKSLCISVFWHAWHWTWEPSCQWIFGAASGSLSNRDALKARDIINSQWYQESWGLRTKIRDDINKVSKYQNEAGGYRISTTIRGVGIGEGADCQVVDDPLKPLDAKSAVERLRVIDWWMGTMSTRINNPQKIRRVIGQQRLDEGDLSGYQMAKDAGKANGYQTLILPAKYEKARVFLFMPKTPLPRDAYVCTSLQQARPELRDPRTQDGQPLWPARFGPKELKELEYDIEGNAAAQLQQRPSSAQGVIFQEKLFKYARLLALSGSDYFVLGSGEYEHRVKVSECRFFQAIDTAQKISNQNDFTAVGTFALTPACELIIFHMMQARIEVPYQMGFLKKCRTGPTIWLPDLKRSELQGVWPLPLMGQWLEDASSGTGLIQTGLVDGIAFNRLNASGGDGIQRSSTLATLYERGNVYHMLGASWQMMFEDQMKTFPAGAHDDMVTVASYGGQLAVHDTLLRAGLAGVERVAQDYSKDRDGEKLPAWQLVDGEVLGEEKDAGVRVHLRPDEKDDFQISLDQDEEDFLEAQERERKARKKLPSKF